MLQLTIIHINYTVELNAGIANNWFNEFSILRNYQIFESLNCANNKKPLELIRSSKRNSTEQKKAQQTNAKFNCINLISFFFSKVLMMNIEAIFQLLASGRMLMTLNNLFCCCGDSHFVFACHFSCNCMWSTSLQLIFCPLNRVFIGDLNLLKNKHEINRKTTKPHVYIKTVIVSIKASRLWNEPTSCHLASMIFVHTNVIRNCAHSIISKYQ